VTAKFKMTPTQYAETTSNTPLTIDLPDGGKTSAKISSVTIDTQSNPLLVTIVATVTHVDYGAVKTGQDGTLVGAKLVLNQNTYWSHISKLNK